MKIAVITNPYIKQKDIKNKLLSNIKSLSSYEIVEIEDFSKLNENFDLVLIFGGDGTILRTAKYAAIYGLPIVGVDLGRLGFLAEFAKECKAEDIIKAIDNKNIAKRMLISASFGGKEENALNEIVVKSTQTKPIYLDLFVDGEYVDSYHSDGIIVSSPTGSTAYSLSAGGPVLAPSLDAMLIIPICPHSLHSRSLVVPSNSKIEIKLKKYINANISIDGEEFASLVPEESLIINKSKYMAQFIVNSKENFFKKLLEKMNKWGITE